IKIKCWRYRRYNGEIYVETHESPLSRWFLVEDWVKWLSFGATPAFCLSQLAARR
ncbi:hypothetical protein HAX54_022499, partial [Datura stramonium]|nr:hypothetical protein [Datura stramonium]